MGWVWRDDNDDESNNSRIADFGNPNPSSYGGDRCSTRRIVKSNCHTEEIGPGKFVRKCEKTEQILKDCVGKPTEIVQSNKEYTEDDVTHEMMKGSSLQGSSDIRSFDFPGLRSDIEAIERNLFGGIGRFFEAADEIKDGFFRFLDDPSLFGGHSSPPARRQGIPIEGGHMQKERETISNKSDSGNLDIAGLARDV